jgi:hypothetical protein
MGRYLFFDDDQVDARRGLTRAFHDAAKHGSNPVFAAERPWEGAVALGRLRGATVRVGLWARNAELYSFAV